MWLKSVGVTGTGEGFDAKDIEAAFNLLGLEFDVLVTLDDDQTISKQARRFCYNNKLHDRSKKIKDGLVEELSTSAGMLVFFGEGIRSKVVMDALSVGMPIVCFPENFKEHITEGWKNSE